jgi:YVTN family beta-propeller protein
MRFPIVVCLVCLAIPASAQVRVYVADSGENRITVIDPQTRKVSGEIRVSANPGAMAASADGHRLYVTSSTRNALDVLDVKTKRVVRSLAVGPLPAGIAVSSDGRRAFVCIGGEGIRGIDVFDTATFVKVRNIPAGRGMQNIYLTPDQTRMIATSAGDKKLAVINVRTEQIEFDIPAGGVPGEIAIESDRNLVIGRLFVQLAGVNGLETIDYKARKASGKIAMPGGAFAIAPDHKSLWAGGVVFSLPDLKRVGEYSAAAGAIAFTPDSKQSFISNPNTDSVSVIDTTTYKEIARIPVGRKPSKLLVSEPDALR